MERNADANFIAPVRRHFAAHEPLGTSPRGAGATVGVKLQPASAWSGPVAANPAGGPRRRCPSSPISAADGRRPGRTRQRPPTGGDASEDVPAGALRRRRRLPLGRLRRLAALRPLAVSRLRRLRATTPLWPSPWPARLAPCPCLASPGALHGTSESPPWADPCAWSRPSRRPAPPGCCIQGPGKAGSAPSVASRPADPGQRQHCARGSDGPSPGGRPRRLPFAREVGRLAYRRTPTGSSARARETASCSISVESWPTKSPTMCRICEEESEEDEEDEEARAITKSPGVS